MVNTPRGRGPRADGAHIRRTATARGIPCVTTVAAALAASAGIVEWESTEATVRSLQEYHRDGQLRLDVMNRRDRSVDLRVELGRLALASPILTASGTFGHGAEVARLGEPSRLGAVTAKSVSPEPWAGQARAAPAPRPPRGCSTQSACRAPASPRGSSTTCPRCAPPGLASIASVWGHTVDDFARAAKMLADADADVIAIEVNASCPNLHSIHDPGAVFSHDPTATSEVVGAVVHATSLPVFAKLSPNVTDLTDDRPRRDRRRRRRADPREHGDGSGHRRGDPASGARRGWWRPLRSGDQTGRVAGGAHGAPARSPASR